MALDLAHRRAPMRSVACRQVAISDYEVIGCGKGWTEPDVTVRVDGRPIPPTCPTCGRPTQITSRWIEIPLPRLVPETEGVSS